MTAKPTPFKFAQMSADSVEQSVQTMLVKIRSLDDPTLLLIVPVLTGAAFAVGLLARRALNISEASVPETVEVLEI